MLTRILIASLTLSLSVQFRVHIYCDHMFSLHLQAKIMRRKNYIKNEKMNKVSKTNLKIKLKRRKVAFKN